MNATVQNDIRLVWIWNCWDRKTRDWAILNGVAENLRGDLIWMVGGHVVEPVLPFIEVEVLVVGVVGGRFKLTRCALLEISIDQTLEKFMRTKALRNVVYLDIFLKDLIL